MEQIETDRLILRDFQSGDFKDYWEYYSHPLVRDGAGLSCSIDNSDLRWAKVRMHLRYVENYGLEYKPTNKLIGEIQLPRPNKTNSRVPEDFKGKNIREMCYMLNPKYHRQGLMTEAVRAVLKHCFEEKNLDGIYLYCFSKNLASIKLSMNCGFRYLSNGKKKIDHMQTTVFAMGITREQYFQDKSKREMQDKAKHDEKSRV